MALKMERPISLSGAEGRLVRPFLRAVGLILLVSGLLHATAILGVAPDGRSFTTMSEAWRAASVAIALADLFAAVGLWIGAAWGPVLWIVAVVLEVGIHTIFAGTFGGNPLRVGLHLSLLAIVAILAFLDWRRSAAG